FTCFQNLDLHHEHRSKLRYSRVTPETPRQVEGRWTPGPRTVQSMLPPHSRPSLPVLWLPGPIFFSRKLMASILPGLLEFPSWTESSDERGPKAFTYNQHCRSLWNLLLPCS
ncbi:mCG3755, isoform CRA_a, partial [Mus musculus]